MSPLNLALISFSVCVIAVGQSAMKFAALKIVTRPGQGVVEFLRDNLVPMAVVGGAVSLYMLSTAAWVYALRTTPLSVAYLFNAMAFLLVPALAVVLFAEDLPRYFLPALALILTAIFLLSRG